jgi:hypothetical protein
LISTKESLELGAWSLNPKTPSHSHCCRRTDGRVLVISKLLETPTLYILLTVNSQDQKNKKVMMV